MPDSVRLSGWFESALQSLLREKIYTQKPIG